MAGQGKELLATDKEAAEKKLAEAELLLVEGCEGLMQREDKISDDSNTLVTGGSDVLVTEAIRRLVDFYTAWEKPDKAAKWKKKLDARKLANESKKP